MSERANCDCTQATPSLSAMVAAALRPVGEGTPATITPVGLAKKARRRLWELPVKHHCVLLGAAFDAGELRQMFRRGGYVDWQTASDYELHSSAVCFAKERNDFSVLAQKRLDERFRPAVHRLAAAKTGDDLVRLWQELVEGGDAAGAYWAALTHPACDEDLDEAFSREMHMIAHEEFAVRRAALRQVRAYQERVDALLERQVASRQEADALRQENASLRDALQAARLEAQRAEAELKRWREGDVARAMQVREVKLTAEVQAARVELDATRRSLRAALRRAERMQRETRTEEPTGCRLIEGSQVTDQQPVPLPNLAGRRVLCIGGKAALIAHYRRHVECAGGNFSHHDGGVEDHVGRLPAMLGAAELVICLAGDCSHAAYRIAKRYCKAKGKPCALMGNSSVSALVGCIGAFSSMDGEQRCNTRESRSRRFISGASRATSASSRSCPA